MLIAWWVFFNAASWAAVAPERHPDWHWAQEKQPPQSLRVGDPLRLTLEAPQSENSSSDDFTITFETEKSSLHEMGWVQQGPLQRDGNTWRVDLIASRDGTHAVPNATLRRKDGPVVAKVPGFQVSVATLKADGEAPPDWLGPEMTDFPTWFVILLGLTGLLAVIGLVWGSIRLWKKFRSRNRSQAIPAKPLDPPDVEALKALDAWAHSQPWRDGRFKPVAFGVTEIAKRYLSRRFGIDAMEMTSEECLQATRRLGVWPDMARWIRDLDEVKFADRVFSQTEMQSRMEELRLMIRSTQGASPT
jgi:hypothetical protein